MPGKTCLYKAYMADKEGNEDILYRTDFDAAKAVVISVGDEFTYDEKRRGIHAALAYGDAATMDADRLTEGEKRPCGRKSQSRPSLRGNPTFKHRHETELRRFGTDIILDAAKVPDK